MDEQNEKLSALAVNSLLLTDGWKVIENWLNNQISMLRDRTEPAGLDNVRVDLLNYVDKVKKNKVAVTVVSIDKDYSYHAVRAYNRFLRQIQDWKEQAEAK